MARIIVSFQADSKYYEEFNPKEEIAKIIIAGGGIEKGDIFSFTTSTIVFDTEVKSAFKSWDDYLTGALSKKFSSYPFHFTIGKLAEFADSGGPCFNEINGDDVECDRFTKQIEKLF